MGIIQLYKIEIHVNWKVEGRENWRQFHFCCCCCCYSLHEHVKFIYLNVWCSFMHLLSSVESIRIEHEHSEWNAKERGYNRRGFFPLNYEMAKNNGGGKKNVI